MIINSKTKIAALLKHHPDALGAIITLSPDFKKLRNPLLRKLMAGRTTIAMASKIGGCTPEDFFEKLRPFGFEVDPSLQKEEETSLSQKNIPQLISETSSANILPVDVRPMLAMGNDPLTLIQQKVKELQPGQVLKIINTFEPSPLVKLLEKQGFRSYVDVIAKDLVETYFYKITGNGDIQVEAEVAVASDWEQVLTQYEGKMKHVDVRHLEMPMPMMTILASLETLPPGMALHVHHKRIPVFLLTEVKDRGFEYRINEIKDGEVYLLIFSN